MTYSLDSSRFGEAIKILRSNLTQRELGHLAGVPKSNISDYETGKKFPAIPTLMKLLAAAGADFHDLADALDQAEKKGEAPAATEEPPEDRAAEPELKSPSDAAFDRLLDGLLSATERRKVAAGSREPDEIDELAEKIAANLGDRVVELIAAADREREGR